LYTLITNQCTTHNSDIIGAAAAEEVASALLELGAAVDRDDANDAAWSTPLHNAIASENPALVRLLLQVIGTSCFVLFLALQDVSIVYRVCMLTPMALIRHDDCNLVEA
jgi:hypothetical protein